MKKLFKGLLSVVVALAMVMTVMPTVEASGATNATTDVACVSGKGCYTSLQDAIVEAAPAGTVEIVNDVIVDTWVMFSKRLSYPGTIINIDINGLTINGNDHTVTINSIVSQGNGNRLFYDAANLNINNLTIKIADGYDGGIGMTSGNLYKVTFEGGIYNVLPGNGEVVIDDCKFVGTSKAAIYYENARDYLTVSNSEFKVAKSAYSIYLRGNEKFKNNIVTKGKTNITSGSSPVVEGNNFNDQRFKVYNGATANISNNTITNLVFNEPNSSTLSTFKGNTLSNEAETALTNANGENLPKDPVATKEPAKATVEFVVDGKVWRTYRVTKGADIRMPEVPEKEGYVGEWDHDGENIRTTTTITAKYTKVEEPVNNNDLSDYANFQLPVYANSRVTNISTANGSITVDGYMFKANADCNAENSIWREIIFVNEEDYSMAKAYRKQVTPVYNTWLNKNMTATGNGTYALDYANYTVTFSNTDINNYVGNTPATKMASGSYLAYMRISDGANSYLFPLKDIVLSDGSTLALPSGFEVVDTTTRALRYIVK